MAVVHVELNASEETAENFVEADLEEICAGNDA